MSIAKRNNILIAEVGVWKSPLSNNPKDREEAMRHAKKQLELADMMGVRCCVNITGAREGRWDGAYASNYSKETYQQMVASIREIIDDVRPTCAKYTIEPMPWMLPDGPDEYLRLIEDVDREQFAVHMDFINMINQPRRYLFALDFIEECLIKLGPFTVSCHIKDIKMSEQFTVKLEETAPGQGDLDFAKVLPLLHKHLDPAMPVLLEHMNTTEEYAKAFAYLKKIAEESSVPIH